MKELGKAIVNVMKAVNGVLKNSTVGSGNYSYKGVTDADVKAKYKKAMSENGLCILPIDVTPKVEIHRFVDGYGKQKTSYFTEVATKYLLLHTSGESQEICGYGHGMDSGDKGAGKATTYALKYALLYTFMTPTGRIDDADETHSEDHGKTATTPEVKKDVVFDDAQFTKAKPTIQVYVDKGLTFEQIKKKMDARYTAYMPTALESLKNMQNATT